MAYFGFNEQTQITTQNVRTTLDLYNASLLQTGPTASSGGAMNTLGQAYYDYDPTYGFWTKYRYVKYKSTDATAMVGYPAPVFWTDEYKTTVSSKMSEGLPATQQSLAGWLMLNTTDLSTITLALLQSNYCFIAVGGFVKAGASAASIVKGDWLIGGATPWVPVRVASGTPTGYTQGAYALSNVSSSKSDLFIVLES